MYSYYILQDPGHNRVYFNHASTLFLAELKIACKKLSNILKEPEIVELAGLNYLMITFTEPALKSDLNILSRLSFTLAIYKGTVIGQQLYLLPIQKTIYHYISPKISNILKYSGKTNELFTRLMINLGILCSDFDYAEINSVLDPVAGKGTTLFEASVLGFNAYGIEIESKSVNEARLFLKKYLEREKIKHQVIEKKYHTQHKKQTGSSFTFEYATNKENFKDEKQRKQLSIFNANTKDAQKFLRKESVHLIVGDLPYGIAHKSKSKSKETNVSRNPAELVSNALSAWTSILKQGGTLVLSWNSFVLSRRELIAVLQKGGLKVFNDEPFLQLEHRVDQAIKRDLLVAKKQKTG